MKSLFEYLISVTFAVALIVITYSVFANTLTGLIETAFEPIAR